jgi:hypothetical protein
MVRHGKSRARPRTEEPVSLARRGPDFQNQGRATVGHGKAGLSVTVNFSRTMTTFEPIPPVVVLGLRSVWRGPAIKVLGQGADATQPPARRGPDTANRSVEIAGHGNESLGRGTRGESEKPVILARRGPDIRLRWRSSGTGTQLPFERLAAEQIRRRQESHRQAPFTARAAFTASTSSGLGTRMLYSVSCHHRMRNGSGKSHHCSLVKRLDHDPPATGFLPSVIWAVDQTRPLVINAPVRAREAAAGAVLATPPPPVGLRTCATGSPRRREARSIAAP